MSVKRGPLVLALFLAMTVLIFAVKNGEDLVEIDDGKKGNRVAVVHLTGAIMDAEPMVLWLHTLTHEVEGIEAIVLAVDSPGGGVAASQEIYSAVKKIRETGIPVVVSMGSVAASGAYYVACAADSILSQPGTLTGSIGVVAEFPQAKKLFDTVGLKFEVVKSGRFKDVGNPARAMTDEEKQLFQGVIDDVYGQFVDAILEEREGPLRTALARQRKRVDETKFDKETLRKYVESFADGRVFSGRRAMELGLVDQLGDRQDAIQQAAKLAGLEDPEVVTRRYKRHWTDFLYGAAESIGVQAARGFRRGWQSSGSGAPVMMEIN